MLERLRSYPQSHPRRFVLVVVALDVAVLVALSCVLIVAMKPKYRSEDTPLSLIENGVKWTDDGRRYSVTMGYSQLQIEMFNGSRSVRWWDLDIPELHNGTRATHSCGTKALDGLTLSLDVTDVTGDGVFGQGDYFILTTTGTDLAMETVYGVRLVYSDGVLHFFREISFAIHEGNIYAWDTTPLQLIR